jgi:YfiH family protein
MEWITRSGLTLGVFPALRAIAPGLDVYITTRDGGVSRAPFESLNLGGTLGDVRSNIDANRKILPRKLARTGQIHGSEIAVVTRGGYYQGFDGFVTATSGLTLAISTADCYSVVIYSPPERSLAALHVGRRGAEQNIIGRAIGSMQSDFGIDATYAVAVVGPGICAKCYTVSREDARRFPKGVRRFAHGAWHLDLASFIAHELVSHGIRRRNIFASKLCNACDPARFFSHRRDGGITGRHWTLATIRAAGERGE